MASLGVRYHTNSLDQPQPSLAVLGSSLFSKFDVLKFENRRCIGKFSTRKNATLSASDSEIPRLIPKSITQNVMDTYLGNTRSELISNNKEYHEVKQELFLKWIRDDNFFIGVEQGIYMKPEFICFDSCIYNPMMTPCVPLRGAWEVYAVKISDVIYLWSETEAEIKESVEALYGIYFKHLLTHENPTATIPNEYEKAFIINELHFGSHQLLCLSEIEAHDEFGRSVKFEVYREFSPKDTAVKNLKFWAQSVVSGTHTLVLGKRDDTGELFDIETIATDCLAHSADWDPHLCNHFQDRLLTWIKSHFKENNPKKVKKFSWGGALNPYVNASDVVEKNIPKAFLPQWYTENLPK